MAHIGYMHLYHLVLCTYMVGLALCFFFIVDLAQQMLLEGGAIVLPHGM